MTREYLAVLSLLLSHLLLALSLLEPAHFYSLKIWYNIVRKRDLLPYSALFFFARLVDGMDHSAFALSALPSQTARKKEGDMKEEAREFLKRGADRVSLWIASRG